jgi:transketolase
MVHHGTTDGVGKLSGGTGYVPRNDRALLRLQQLAPRMRDPTSESVSAKEEFVITTDEKTPSTAELDQLAINTVRFLSVDAVQRANSGHPGLPLGAAPMAYVLWNRFLRHNPSNPQWFNRDRFVLSAGHGSMLLYSLLHLTGYALSLDEIKRFRQWGSLTPGHPERGLTPGVEVTTGPLGQGFANGVGMAIAEAHLAARFNQPNFPVVDHFTYALVSDGDLMEGVASEAASLAGQLGLGKLVYLYDNNHVTLAASTGLTFTEDRAGRFAAYGWHVQRVADGNDLLAIERTIKLAQDESTRPSLIIIDTHLGFGSPHKQDSFEAHGSPLGEEEVRLTKLNLGWPTEPAFYIPANVAEHFRQAIPKGAGLDVEWNDLFHEYALAYPEFADELRQRISGDLPLDWSKDLPSFPPDAKGMATRVAGGKALAAIASRVSALMGGSADLDPSTHTQLKNAGDFARPSNNDKNDRVFEGESGGGRNYAGRNLHFGVREHAMGAIANGLAAHGGVLPYTATFLTFSDYMRPPIRLAALMRLRVVFVFTHDSVAMGEDGPTHQPIEHLASLRAIPHLTVIRPADANESAVAWCVAVESRDRPVALVLGRQNVPILDRSQYASAEGLRRGAYVLYDPTPVAPQLILLASGSEVQILVDAEKLLRQKGIFARVVSMASWELFEAQPADYRASVLPAAIRARLAVEAGVAQGWQHYVGDMGAVLGIEKFGASAPGPMVFKEYGFTPEHVCNLAVEVLARQTSQAKDT